MTLKLLQNANFLSSHMSWRSLFLLRSMKKGRKPRTIYHSYHLGFLDIIGLQKCLPKLKKRPFTWPRCLPLWGYVLSQENQHWKTAETSRPHSFENPTTTDQIPLELEKQTFRYGIQMKHSKRKRIQASSYKR